MIDHICLDGKFLLRYCRNLLALCLPLLGAGCNISSEHPALQHGQLPSLTQAHSFAYPGLVHGAYQLSPDGNKLAWIGPSFGRSALIVRDYRNGQLNKYRARSPTFSWTPDSRRLLFTADTSGAENTHVYAIDTEQPATGPVDLTPYRGVRASIFQIGMPDAGHVLISHNRRDPRVFDLYRVELDSGKETLIAKNPGDGVAPIAGRKGAIEGWFRPRETRRLAAAQRAQAATPPQAVPLKQPEEHFSVLGAAADRSFVWALSNRGRDRVALVIAHPTLRWEKVVFEDADADVSEVSMSRVTGAPLLATAQPGYPRVTILDASLRADLDGLLRAQGAAPFGVEIVSSDHAERRMIVSVYTSTQRRFYLLDRPKRQFELLAEALPRDLEEVLAPMRPIVIKSRDGLALHGYLTLPRGVAPKALPMVLLVHSGPWERSLWVDPTRAEDSLRAQFLANRGYAVLQVDFRGSKGYGSSFFDAGIGEFAGEMQDDLLDAVHWAVDGGIADPAHVAIMGWSYGGYAALVGMSMTPEVFACGISLAGPTDLASLIESFPPYWKVDLTMWHDFVGDPAVPAEREEMTLKSPLSHAAQVQRPVLIVHGAQDVRVRINQSERMVQALRQAGKPVEYVPIADMGHGMSYWAHRLAILRKTERFLQRCLGGRASRYDPFDTIAWAWTRLSR